MMNISIKSSSDLKAAILELRATEKQQSAELKLRFSSPSAIFHTLGSLFPRSPDGSSGFFNQDIFGLLSRVLLPLTLNKTLFRNSNFLVKTLVGFVSQKASHLVNEKSVTGIWDKVTSLFEKKSKSTEDHRIPIDSEVS